MSKKNIITAIAALIATGCSFALEAAGTPSNDLSFRVSLGIAPGIDEVENSSGTLGVDDEDGVRLELLAVKRFWSANNPNFGGSIGGGFFFGGHSFEEPDVEVELTTFGTMIQGGLICKMDGGFVFELGPYLGLGTAHNETTGYSDGTGPYFLYGIKGSAFMLISETVELGVDLGYEGFSHEQEYETFGFKEDVTYSGSGAYVAIILGVNF